jgi:RsiW-degrading membrane proteinase PrsW (M82 family)
MGELITPDLIIFFALLQSVFFLLLIRFLDLYEREPLAVLALMFAWGAVGAGILALPINAAILDLLPPKVGALFGEAIAGPLAEETTKGLALVVAFLLSRWVAGRFGGLEFEGLTDGVVYGAAVGLGFAFTEDLFYYLTREGGLEEYLRRVDFFGVGQLGHAVYAGVFGAGLGLATWSRSWAGRLGIPALGLAAAMLMHAVHNGLVNLALVLRYGMESTAVWKGRFPGFVPRDVAKQMDATDAAAAAVNGWVGYAFVAAFFLAIALWLWYQRRIIRRELAEEAESGVITRAEWELMPRYWRRSARYWRLLREGKLERWRLVRRVHNELVDLAFLKWRLRKVGGDWGKVEKLRRRIVARRSQEVVE